VVAVELLLDRSIGGGVWQLSFALYSRGFVCFEEAFNYREEGADDGDSEVRDKG